MADVKVGTWGGDGGSPWTFKANGRISGIRISTGELVDSIQFTYTDNDGVKHVSERYGGPGGSPDTITFEDDEELTGISGLVFEERIGSLSFQTNKTIYGAFGPDDAGIAFSLPVDEGEIVGFYGTSGDVVDSIGVILRAIE